MKDLMGRTAVHYLAMNGKDSRSLELLTKQECNLDVRDNEGMTPIMYACVGGPVEPPSSESKSRIVGQFQVLCLTLLLQKTCA